MGNEPLSSGRSSTRSSFGEYKNPSNPRPGYYVKASGDKKEVWYKGKRLYNVDAPTFQKLGKGWARDKTGYVYRGERTNDRPDKPT